MLRFKKPRYKIYLRISEDIRNDFKLEKFNSLKWKKLKKKLRFKKNKWSVFLLKNKLYYSKKLRFVYNHSGVFSGTKKRVFTRKNENSIFSFWSHKRLRKEFKNNLLNKQKLLFYYNIQNYKLKKLVRKNIVRKDNSSTFVQLLEKRLDNVLWKAGLVKSLYQSRQLINHGKVLINKLKQSKIDYITKVGDLIELSGIPDSYLRNNLATFVRIKKKKIRKKKISIIFNKRLKNKILLKNRFLLFNLKNFNFFQINSQQCNFRSRKQLLKSLRSDKYQKQLLNILKLNKQLSKTLDNRRYLLKLIESKNRFSLIKLKKFTKKRKKLKFRFLYFFPTFVEINYKTLSILVLKDINIKKSFKFFVNLLSVSNYYFHN